MFKILTMYDRPVGLAHGVAPLAINTSILLWPVTKLVDLLLAWESRIAEREHLAGLNGRLRADAGLPNALIAEQTVKPFCYA